MRKISLNLVNEPQAWCYSLQTSSSALQPNWQPLSFTSNRRRGVHFDKGAMIADHDGLRGNSFGASGFPAIRVGLGCPRHGMDTGHGLARHKYGILRQLRTQDPVLSHLTQPREAGVVEQLLLLTDELVILSRQSARCPRRAMRSQTHLLHVDCSPTFHVPRTNTRTLRSSPSLTDPTFKFAVALTLIRGISMVTYR